MDFQAITATTQRYNSHTHTQFCDGHAPMEEFVKAAIDHGMTHLGFTPHSPIPVESPCNMARDAVKAYLAEVERLQTLYGSRLRIYAGMEIDYLGDYGPRDAFFEHLPLDYSIASIHFLPAMDRPGVMVDVDGKYEAFKVKMDKFFHNDIEAVVRLFFDQSVKMVEAGGFDVVGHFDKIGNNASQFREGIDKEPWYDALVLRLFEAIMDRRLTVEVNTKMWETRKRFFPHLKFFKLLKKYRTPLLFNSDAHVPALIDAGREEAMRLFSQA